MEYRGKRVIVLGMGRTGEAVRDFLSKRGAEVCAYDDRAAYRSRADLCDRYDFAVVSPGFPPSNRAFARLKERGLPILSELDLAYINSPSHHIYAVSGTNGKTTTSTILHAMLSAVCRSHLVGNVGTPFLSVIDSVEPKDAVVVEVSSFQIEQSALFRPEIAALTNVGEDHLDRHGDAANYRRIKLSLAQGADRAVLNGDDPVESGVAGIRYSVLKPSAEYYLAERSVYVKGKGYALPERSRGDAFDRDWLCAFAVACTAFGVRKEFFSSYENVVLPPYRFQPAGRLCGATVINDSKGTNVDAALFALSLCRGRTAIILGGSDKGEDYVRLMRGMGEATRIYLVGGNASELYAAADGYTRAKCLPMADLESAVSHFVSDPLDTLLFSPACASFDRYRDYEERGRDFDAIVEKHRKSD